MPLFDYRCEACEHQFETIQGINDEPLTECPECRKDELKKLVSAPSFTFKGGGWYKDLYGSSNKNAKDSTSTSSTSTSSSSSNDSSKSTEKSTAKASAAAS